MSPPISLGFLKSNVDRPALLAEINALPKTVDGTKTLMAFGQSAGIPADCPEIRKAVDEIAALRGLAPLHVMANELPAGVVVPFHRDYLKPSPLQGNLPRLERWHLVVQTNSQAFWLDQYNPPLHMAAGYWCGPVAYWKDHSVSNLGPAARVHLIVDLDCPEPLGEYDP